MVSTDPFLSLSSRFFLLDLPVCWLPSVLASVALRWRSQICVYVHFLSAPSSRYSAFRCCVAPSSSPLLVCWCWRRLCLGGRTSPLLRPDLILPSPFPDLPVASNLLQSSPLPSFTVRQACSSWARFAPVPGQRLSDSDCSSVTDPNIQQFYMCLSPIKDLKQLPTCCKVFLKSG